MRAVFTLNSLSKWVEKFLALLKGSFLRGNLAAVMRDPSNFANPETFSPERFLHPGIFDLQYHVTHMIFIKIQTRNSFYLICLFKESKNYF